MRPDVFAGKLGVGPPESRGHFNFTMHGEICFRADPVMSYGIEAAGEKAGIGFVE